MDKGLTSAGDVKSLRERKQGSHKGDNGTVLVIAGSKQYHGAEILAAKAASLFADLVFVLTEKENVPYAKSATPLIIVSEFTKKNLEEFAEKSDSILIGPGLSANKKNKYLINLAVKEFPKKKFVLDATALRLLDSKNLHGNCLVTPHADEFRSLFGAEPLDEEVFGQAEEHNCIVFLKGNPDLISDGKRLWENKTGNALMSAGGTGDVLAGTAAAFASQNPLLESALAAAFLAGFAGDEIAKTKAGLNAEMLLGMLPKAKRILGRG